MSLITDDGCSLLLQVIALTSSSISSRSSIIIVTITIITPHHHLQSQPYLQSLTVANCEYISDLALSCAAHCRFFPPDHCHCSRQSPRNIICFILPCQRFRFLRSVNIRCTRASDAVLVRTPNITTLNHYCSKHQPSIQTNLATLALVKHQCRYYTAAAHSLSWLTSTLLDVPQFLTPAAWRFSRKV
jgi:hypothetical protein